MAGIPGFFGSAKPRSDQKGTRSALDTYRYNAGLISPARKSQAHDDQENAWNRSSDQQNDSNPINAHSSRPEISFEDDGDIFQRGRNEVPLDAFGTGHPTLSCL